MLQVVCSAKLGGFKHIQTAKSIYTLCELHSGVGFVKYLFYDQIILPEFLQGYTFGIIN